MSAKVIVNADDFGKDENCSSAIIECFEKGLISQTTLMVNMPYTEEAVRLAKRKAIDSHIGLHITLTEGVPITDQIKECRTFCDDNGCFLKNGFRSVVYGRYKKNEENALRIELEAQICRYLDLELPLMHCDGHHHAHIALPVFYVLAPLLVKYQFRSVRKHIYSSWDSLFHPHIRVWLQNYLRRYPRQLKKVDYFGSVEHCIRHWKLFQQGKSVEVMVHPRYNSEGSLVDFKVDDGELMSVAISDLLGQTKRLFTYGSILH